MNRKLTKSSLAVVVLLLTLFGFAYYFKHHPEAVAQIRTVPVAVLLLLVGLYGGTVVALCFVYEATLDLCGARLRRKENLLLTIYSSVVNFFGPLQSGPGFRAVYLRKRHNTKLAQYTLATLVYYVIFAVISGIFLLSGLIGLPAMSLILLLGICLWVLIIRSSWPIARRLRELRLGGVYKLLLATFAQLALVAVIYYVELHSLNPHVRPSQAIVYAGAANFALFVSITPGAIGFRESFLLLAARLHHIDKATILSASLIDRAVYIAFLGILFVIALSVHARDQLTSGQAASSSDEI